MDNTILHTFDYFLTLNAFVNGMILEIVLMLGVRGGILLSPS